MLGGTRRLRDSDSTQPLRRMCGHFSINSRKSASAVSKNQGSLIANGMVVTVIFLLLLTSKTSSISIPDIIITSTIVLLIVSVPSWFRPYDTTM